MEQEQSQPDKQEESRNPDGTFKQGISGNPNGRPKGKTLKEFAREFLMNMDDEAKKVWMSDLGKDVVWKMAEGMPKQDIDQKTEVTSKIVRLDE